MPFNVSLLSQVTIEVTELGKIVLRRLDSLSSEEINWLRAAETHVLTSRAFVAQIIQKLLKSPAADLESILAWSDDRLIEVGAKWLEKHQRIPRQEGQKQAEVHSLEEL